MSAIAFINCSLKKENSVTGFLFNLINEDKSNEYSIYNIQQILDDKEILKSIFNYDKLVLGMPLYIDFIPAQCIELLELFEKNEKRFKEKAKLYVLVNSGYIDPHKNHLAIEALKIFGKKAEIEWGGALAVGAAEMIKNNYENKAIPYKVKRDFISSINTFSDAIWWDMAIEDLYTSYKIKPKIFVLLSKIHWVKLAKGNGLNKREIYNTPFYYKDSGE